MSLTKMRRAATVALVAAAALLVPPQVAAQAYSPTTGTIYQLPASQACLKGRGNCAIYPKAAQLSSGRLVATFELSTVPSSGSAAGQTLPVYKSDDFGKSWQPLSQVAPPSALSSDPADAKYKSNWTNGYLYVLPQAVGNLPAGTLMLASVVSGDDQYYLEHKAADAGWTPTNDGDRQDLAIALYSSADQGASWTFRNIVVNGGWQGGSAGAIGTNVAAANTSHEVDPVWEPYLIVYNNRLVAYYSDENDYTSFSATTGALTVAGDNATGPDSTGQILAHKTWDGVSTSWSSAVVDVAGNTTTTSTGQSEIGGGRPGMANVVPTADGKWMMTYEYWGGGDNVRYKIANDPLSFFTVNSVGSPISGLSVTPGSGALARGGSPVLIRMPDGRLVYNAAGSGSVWVNAAGTGTGTWTQYQTSVGAGYSRSLTYVAGTGRIEIIANQGTSTIVYADVDLGGSDGPYYRLVNRLTGQVIGTGNHTNDANLGNADTPDVRLETSGSAANADTQAWHLTQKGGGAVTLLNKSGGRAAAVWTGSATAGQLIGQWVDNTAAGLWNLVPSTTGYYKLQSTASTTLYLTGAAAGASLTLQTATTDGSQDWQPVQLAGYSGTHALVGEGSSRCIDVPNHSTALSTQIQIYDCNLGTNQKWTFSANGSIVGVESGLCLDVRGQSSANGAAVQTYTCSGQTNQKWTAGPGGTLVGVQSGKCLDVAGAGTANTTRVDIWDCNSGSNQRWGIG